MNGDMVELEVNRQNPPKTQDWEDWELDWGNLKLGLLPSILRGPEQKAEGTE